MSVSSEGRGNLKWGILLPTEQLARPQGSCAPVPGYSEFPKCGVSLRASLGTGSHGPRGLAECLIEDSRDRKGWVGTLLRVCRGGKVPEARVHSLALLSGFPLTSSRLWGIPGAPPPVPIWLGGGIADRAVQGRRSPATSTLRTSQSLQPSFPWAFLPRRGAQVRDTARSSHFGKCQARAAPGLLSPPAAPPSTPGSSSSSSFPPGGGSRLRKPRRPRPGRHWRFGEGGPRGSAPRGT